MNSMHEFNAWIQYEYFILKHCVVSCQLRNPHLSECCFLFESWVLSHLNPWKMYRQQKTWILKPQAVRLITQGTHLNFLDVISKRQQAHFHWYLPRVCFKLIIKIILTCCIFSWILWRLWLHLRCELPSERTVSKRSNLSVPPGEWATIW